MSQWDDAIWRRLDDVDRVFREALERPEAERAAWVAEACGRDEELLGAVQMALRGSTASLGMFEAPDIRLSRDAWEALLDAEGPGPTPPDPTQVGRFRIIRRLGRGGMGTVYLGEREGADFNQQVAIKVLRRGIDTEDAIRRFVDERRILARLEHPGIARLLDGGATDDGRPYLVMEFVEGTPITVHCDTRRAPIDDRLLLFLDVADAVSFAHANLVVHRDLKPSNILIDASGRPRLLDFGIAKILSDDEDTGYHTRTGRVLLTPGSASPEQMRGEPVTTAADVYALGSLLYLLLTGRPPHDVKGLAGAELVAHVTATMPIPPSAAAVEDADEPAEERARRRGTTPEKLRRLLRRDLDTVILKALQPDPQRRYQGIEEFAADVRRWQQGLPVTARPDSWGYRTRRFGARHRWAIAATTIAVAGTAAGLAAHTVRLETERDRAELAAAEAERMMGLLTSLFEQADPGEARGEDLTAAELLDRGASRLNVQLADEPGARARLLAVIGRVYAKLNLFERAATTLTAALELRQAVDSGHTVEMAQARTLLAEVLQRLGRMDEALDVGRTALADWRALESPPGFGVAASLKDLGNFHHLTGDPAGGSAYFEEFLGVVDTLPREPRPELVALIFDAAQIHSTRNLDKALDLQQEGLELARTLYGDIHPDVVSALVARSSSLIRADRLEEAVATARQGREVALAVHAGGPHTQIAVAENALGWALFLWGRFDEAEPIMRSSLDMHREVEGNDSIVVGQQLYQLAGIQLARGELTDADRLFRESISFNESRFGPASVMTLQPKAGLANLRLRQGRTTEADRLLAEMEEIWPSSSIGRLSRADVHVGRGIILLQQGRFVDAEASLRQGLEMHEAAQPRAAWKAAEAKGWIGDALLGRGAHAEAETLLLESLQSLEALPSIDADVLAAARDRLVRLYRAMGNDEAARRYAAR